MMQMLSSESLDIVRPAPEMLVGAMWIPPGDCVLQCSQLARRWSDGESEGDRYPHGV
jgi:hypothetical protein